MQYLILIASVAIIVGTFFIFKKFFVKHSAIVLKILSLTIAALFFVRYLLPGSPKLYGVYKLTVKSPFSSPFLCGTIGILVWLSMFVHVILLLAPFFNFKVLKNYAKTLGLFVSVMQVCLLNQFIFASTGTYALTWTGAIMAVETAIKLLMCVYYLCTDNYFKIPKKERIEMYIVLPFFLLSAMPPYIPSLFLGNIGHTMVKSFSLSHRLYLYLSFIVFFAVYFTFRKKDREYNRMVLLFISLGTLISYCCNYDFTIFIRPIDWPLHLCNTVMFIIPLCLIFDWKKLFYFTMFINVIGALLAMFIPSVNEGSRIFTPSVVNFWINHIMAFAMPALTIFLRVYERPKLKQFTYSMIAFFVYFAFVLFLNAWFTNYNQTVDFFYLNSDFIVDKLGNWAIRTRDLVKTFNLYNGLKLTFYPVYQALFFMVYVAFGLGMWFVYAALFQLEDFYIELKAKDNAIKADEKLLLERYNKKEIADCMNENSKDKLVVSGVYKRYGKNKNYAVEDINFEVNSGEILGFLGPNGAGKSTIIKCIVGIQPATKGTIEINGYDIQKQPVETKKQFGFVPDHYALYENMSGREYVNYIADLYNVSKQDRDEIVERLITQLNLKDSFDSPIKTYSHGMKQKITIISAFVHNPKLCILDEPLTGLDPISIYQLKECMRDHARKGNIVFFSSHIIDIVEKLCDRIIVLNNHHIMANITLNELADKGIGLEKFYLQTIGQDVEALEEENKKAQKVKA